MPLASRSPVSAISSWSCSRSCRRDRGAFTRRGGGRPAPTGRRAPAIGARRGGSRARAGLSCRRRAGAANRGRARPPTHGNGAERATHCRRVQRRCDALPTGPRAGALRPRPRPRGRRRQLPGKDSNLEYQGQNLACCRLHHPARAPAMVASPLAPLPLRPARPAGRPGGRGYLAPFSVKTGMTACSRPGSSTSRTSSPASMTVSAFGHEAAAAAQQGDDQRALGQRPSRHGAARGGRRRRRPRPR